jgi:cytosine/adenosine deaminase-related metal-dependent hydrolase
VIVRAKYVLPMAQPPVEDGAVAVAGDTIVAIGKSADIRRTHGGDVRDLGEAVLLPGLINAHCHLDYTDMAGEVEWRGSFIEWVLQLVALKKLRSDNDYLRAIRNGMDLLARSGTTTVVNIESFPHLIEKALPVPLRTFWCVELIDWNSTEPADKMVKETLNLIARLPPVPGGYGLSPHAPYTVSAGLYRLTARYARGHHLLFTTHVAESEEEDDMFRRGTGPMYDYFLRAGRDMSDCKRVGVVQLLSELAALGEYCLAVHVNCLTAQDVQLFKASRAHVVHCPRSHRFFKRDLPMLGAFWERGINVCLGTDSMASNPAPAGLNMFAEMQTLAHMFPKLAAEQILEMATICPARALNLADKLGKIAPGAWADLIAVPLDGEPIDPYEAVVYAEKPVSFSMVAGKVVVG